MVRAKTAKIKQSTTPLLSAARAESLLKAIVRRGSSEHIDDDILSDMADWIGSTKAQAERAVEDLVASGRLALNVSDGGTIYVRVSEQGGAA